MKSYKFNSYFLKYSVALWPLSISIIWRFCSNLIIYWSYAGKLLLDGNWSADLLNWMHCTELFPTYIYTLYPRGQPMLNFLVFLITLMAACFSQQVSFLIVFTQSLTLCPFVLLTFKCLQLKKKILTTKSFILISLLSGYGLHWEHLGGRNSFHGFLQVC